MSTVEQKLDKVISILQAENAISVDVKRAIRELDTPEPQSAFKKSMARVNPGVHKRNRSWNRCKRIHNAAIERASSIIGGHYGAHSSAYEIDALKEPDE